MELVIRVEKSFDVQIFHQIKPVNQTYGNKNPTITSNSFGYRLWIQLLLALKYWYNQHILMELLVEQIY